MFIFTQKQQLQETNGNKETLLMGENLAFVLAEFLTYDLAIVAYVTILHTDTTRLHAAYSIPLGCVYVLDCKY
jgi:hypothetical protein